MGDTNVIESVGPTSVGRKNPQCLRIVVTIQDSTALCSFLGANLAEHAVLELFPYHIICIRAGRNGTAKAVGNVAADLNGGQSVEIVTLSGGGRRRLRFHHAHEAGDSS